MEESMKTLRKHWGFYPGLCVISLTLFTPAHGHEGGGVNTKDLVEVALVPNPSVPQFANAKGTAALDLSKGVIRLEDMEGFPINPTKNLPLTINLTSTTNPRFTGEGGQSSATSCHESDSTWTCHVHSYVVWLVGFADGALGHAIPLGTIYPRTDGSAADRDFSAREGDLTGLGANTLIITGEPSFGPLASVIQSAEGEVATQMVPLGPVVLQVTLP
jgi:hypothetical protein